jgi:hypothetical protein
MKKAFLFIVFLFAAANSFAQTTVYVQGYTRSNGIYVQDHYRTPPPSNNLGSYTHTTEYKFNQPVCVYRQRETLPGGYYLSSSYSNPAHKISSDNNSQTNNPVYLGSKYSYYIKSNCNTTNIN